MKFTEAIDYVYGNPGKKVERVKAPHLVLWVENGKLNMKNKAEIDFYEDEWVKVYEPKEKEGWLTEDFYVLVNDITGCITGCRYRTYDDALAVLGLGLMGPNLHICHIDHLAECFCPNEEE